MQGLFADMLPDKLPDKLREGRTEADLGYLYRAVTNRCLNVIRDRGNRRRLLDENEISLRGPVRTGIEGQAIGRDLLFNLVDRLDDGHNAVLIARFFDDMTQEEAAAHLGVSRKTVQNRTARIRTTIHELEASR